MTAQETYTAQAAANHAAWKAESDRRYNAWKEESNRKYNAWKEDSERRYSEWQAAQATERAERAQARQEETRKQGQQRRTAPTDGTVPAHWAETLILQTGYRAAAMANHPDRGGDHNRMVAINAAYSTMKAQGRI